MKKLDEVEEVEVETAREKRDTLHENAQEWWRGMDMESRVSTTVAWKFKTTSIYKSLPFLSIDMNPDAIERIYRETQLGEDLP